MIEAVLSSPLFGLGLSIAAYVVGSMIQKKTGWVLANPLMLAVAMCISVLVLLEIPYETYYAGAQVISWLLGPVTALLALGIYNQRKVLKEYFLPVLLGCFAGSATSIGSVLALCWLFGVDKAVAASLMPKSCTNPIAVPIAVAHGGLASIAACCVILAGLVGAMFAPQLCKLLGIKDPVAQGLATGAGSHALGTAKAREMGELQGAMSSIAIGVCGLISVAISMFIQL